MPNQWYILVVEDDENLNRSFVTSLRIDGYYVQGVMSGAEAIRVLWSQEYHIVICDLKNVGAGQVPSRTEVFELLQWIRTYRPNTRVIIVGTSMTRTQAFESGATSYLEQPLDLHILKEELRRLLQQTGFSANLDSFDLLDVIQIITLSRKTIALVVNTGLEERGILRFQEGELVWAEYGILQGEEAFFALAAHKNGTVIHQPWNERITPNVTQPLSRLILQALQYREKYAAYQQLSGEQAAIPKANMQTNVGAQFIVPPSIDDPIDDTPFLVLTEAEQGTKKDEPVEDEPREWWQQSSKHTQLNKSSNIHAVTDGAASMPPVAQTTTNNANPAAITPSTVRKTPASERTDLPSWLIDQPTQFEMPALHPSSLSGRTYVPATPSRKPKSSSGNTPIPPLNKPAPAEWQPPPTASPPSKTTEPIIQKRTTSSQKLPAAGAKATSKKSASPEWQAPEQASPLPSRSASLQNVSPSTNDTPLGDGDGDHQSARRNGATAPQRVERNYPALVATLQTLGYSLAGFIATAILNMDGQPIAQVAVDELDISPMCGYFARILQSTLLALDSGNWGLHEDTIITTSEYHILLRVVGSEREAFHVLMITREADPKENLEVMANVESAISAAL